MIPRGIRGVRELHQSPRRLSHMNNAVQRRNSTKLEWWLNKLDVLLCRSDRSFCFIMLVLSVANLLVYNWLFFGNGIMHDTDVTTSWKDVGNRQTSEIKDPSVRALVELYRDQIASKSHLGWQVEGWNNVAGLTSDEYIYSTPATSPRPVDLMVKKDGTHNMQAKVPRRMTLATNDSKSIVWDSQQDIPGYFDELLKKCSTSIDFSYQDCFGYLHSFISQPFCTTRLDSRYVCDGAKVDAPGRVDEMIERHLRDDTLNVIIIGAGPVGLLLANSLSQLGTLQREDGKDMSIRTLVFENRLADASQDAQGNSAMQGQKKTYSRDWITAIYPRYFDETVDPRINAFFRLITGGKKFVTLPIAMIETLLLMSCRDKGVKFVYANYEDYLPFLQKVHNTVIFDATGRRLDLAVRAANNPYLVGASASHNPDRKVLTESNNEGLRHNHNHLVPLIRYNATVLVAEQETVAGPMRYPLNRANNMPLQLSYLKIMNLWSSPDDIAFENINDLAMDLEMPIMPHSIRNTESRICCEMCASERLRTCIKMCSTSRMYDFKRYYEAEIELSMKQLKNGEELFATSGLFVSLLPRQRSVFESLAGGRTGKEIPLHALKNAKAMLEDPELQINGVAKILNATFVNAANRTDPLFSMFSYHPFIYPDPLVPPLGIVSPLNQLNAPVLRIGDSLFQGDPNSSTGLTHHAKVVQRLVNRLAELKIPV